LILLPLAHQLLVFLGEKNLLLRELNLLVTRLLAEDHLVEAKIFVLSAQIELILGNLRSMLLRPLLLLDGL